MTTAVVCAGCGTALTIPRTGRPPRWCSKSCRQAGYRARQAAGRAAEQAAWCLGRMAGARTSLNEANALLAAAYARMTDAVAAAWDDVDAALRTGARWEMPLRDAARALQATAGQIAQLALDHRQAASDYQNARAVFTTPTIEHASTTAAGGVVDVGLRRMTAPPSRNDETRPSPTGSVSTTAADTAGTKPAGAVVDRDELFDAVDDLVELLRFSTDLSPELPQAVAAALESPAAKLDAVFEQQAGDGPIDELVAAAGALLAAAWAYEAQLPGELAAAIGRLDAALQGPR